MRNDLHYYYFYLNTKAATFINILPLLILFLKYKKVVFRSKAVN